MSSEQTPEEAVMVMSKNDEVHTPVPSRVDDLLCRLAGSPHVVRSQARSLDALTGPRKHMLELRRHAHRDHRRRAVIERPEVLRVLRVERHLRNG
jgi:hypothetical protein